MVPNELMRVRFPPRRDNGADFSIVGLFVRFKYWLSVQEGKQSKSKWKDGFLFPLKLCCVIFLYFNNLHYSDWLERLRRSKPQQTFQIDINSMKWQLHSQMKVLKLLAQVSGDNMSLLWKRKRWSNSLVPKHLCLIFFFFALGTISVTSLYEFPKKKQQQVLR